MKIVFQTLAIVAILLAGAFFGIRILREAPRSSAPSAEHGGEAAAPEYERGPHGGRMLRDGDLAIEITIYEPDIPPQSRIYPFLNDKPLDPDKVKVALELHRFGTRVDAFTYKKDGEFLMGNRVVEEPHSFDVKVSAEYEGKKSSWTYESYEGRVKISDAAAASVGIESEKAGPREIRKLASMVGRIVPDEDHKASVTPRFPGIVLEARKKLGDKVEKGELLAVIESSQSLTTYQVTAPISGIIIARDVTSGVAVTPDKPIYVVADPSNVWVELNVRRENLAYVEKGREVTITDEHSGDSATAVITYLSPFGSQETQTLRAIATLPNAESKWRTGLLVGASVVAEKREVPVAVKVEALQTFRDWDVVFMKYGDTYEIAILELGQRDGDWIEVVSGLPAGTEYVTSNAFVVKADVMKSGASHDH